MREITVTQYIEYDYDSDKDRSEECGWSKVCDERVPTEQEQTFWGNVTIGYVVFTLVMLYVVA